MELLATLTAPINVPTNTVPLLNSNIRESIKSLDLVTVIARMFLVQIGGEPAVAMKFKLSASAKEPSVARFKLTRYSNGFHFPNFVRTSDDLKL